MFYSILFKKVLYLCIEFFMVLDFKVNKIDCREIINFFLHLSQAPLSTQRSTQHSAKNTRGEEVVPSSPRGISIPTASP
jgi:hypothetical protein